MKIKFDENYYVTGYCTLGYMEGAVEFLGAVPDDFSQNFNYYKLEIDKWYLDSAKKTDYEIMRALRAERQDLIVFLFATDYVSIKIAEGASTKEEYADVLQQRQAARDRINEIDSISAPQ